MTCNLKIVKVLNEEEVLKLKLNNEKVRYLQLLNENISLQKQVMELQGQELMRSLSIPSDGQVQQDAEGRWVVLAPSKDKVDVS